MTNSETRKVVRWGGQHEITSKAEVRDLWSAKGLGGLPRDQMEEARRQTLSVVTFKLTLDHLSKYLTRSPGWRMLEIGCGWGRIFLGVKGRYPDVDYTGVDLTPNLVELSRHHAGQFEVSPPYRHLTGDAENLSFNAEQFDFACSVRVFQYVLDISRAMSEAYRVLRPGGWFAILLPNGHNPVRKLNYKTSLPKSSEMRDWFETAGFVDIETTFFAFMPVTRRLPMKRLDRFAEALGHVPGIRRLGGHVIVAGRRPE